MYQSKCPGMTVSGETALSLKMLSHDHAYTAAARDVLITAFSSQGVLLQKLEAEKRISGALTRMVDTGDPDRGVRKP